MPPPALLQVSCAACRLEALWTDQPTSFLETVCQQRFACRARLVDELRRDVSDRHRPRQPWLPAWVPEHAVQTLLTSAFASAAAAMLAVAAASAYQAASMGATIAVAGLPPLVVLLLYAAAPRSTVLALLSVLVSGAGATLVGAERLGTSPLDALALIAAAVAVPVGLDLVRLDLGWRAGLGLVSRRTAVPIFLAALGPMLFSTLVDATRTARAEDARLIERLAEHVSVTGDSLVIDRLDPRTARKAQSRIALRAGGQVYDLSHASIEQVAEQRTATKRLERHGKAPSIAVDRQRHDEVRLTVALAAGANPRELEFESVRGPTTLYHQTIALAR